jgi:hypothetical protein
MKMLSNSERIFETWLSPCDQKPRGLGEHGVGVRQDAAAGRGRALPGEHEPRARGQGGARGEGKGKGEGFAVCQRCGLKVSKRIFSLCMVSRG